VGLAWPNKRRRKDMKKTMFLGITFVLILFSFSLAQNIGSQKVVTIDECVQIGLKNSYLVRSAEEYYKAAKWDLVGAWQNFLPSSQASFNWDRSDVVTVRYIEGKPPFYRRDNYSWSFYISQNLFDGFYSFANYNSKRSSKRLSEDELKLARQQTVFKVKQDCYELLKAQMLFELQKDAVKRSEEQLNMAKARYDLGSASLSDYLKAKVQLGEDSLALITYENNVKLAKATLNTTLGLDIGTLIKLAEKLGEYQGFETDLKRVLKESLAKHPELHKAKMEENKAHSQITMARSQRFPKVTLSAGYSWSNYELPDGWNEYREIFDPWGIRLNLSLNIFDGFSILSNEQSAKAFYHQAQENLKQRKRDTELEIRKAFLKVKEGEQKLRVAEEAMKAAEEDMKLTQEKYNLGAASMLELLDANVSHKTSQNSQVEALYDYNLAVALFEKAIGK